MRYYPVMQMYRCESPTKSRANYFTGEAIHDVAVFPAGSVPPGWTAEAMCMDCYKHLLIRLASDCGDHQGASVDGLEHWQRPNDGPYGGITRTMK